METKRARGRPPKNKKQPQIGSATGVEAVTPREGKPDQLIDAKYVRPSSMKLVFADGFSGIWQFRDLALDMSNMKLATIKPSDSGASVNVQSKWNDAVELDASALRATVDPAYAAQLEKAFLAIRGPIDDLT